MDEKVPEMSCCDICMGHIDKKIIKKFFCKSQTGHVDEKMLQMSCYDICMGHNKNFFSHMSQLTRKTGHNKNFFSHMSQLTGKAGHNIQIFLHMSRFFIESIFIKYEKVLWTENINGQEPFVKS